MNDLSILPEFAGTRPYRLRAEDYLRMIEASGFGDDHVELVEGELVQMAPAGMDHGRTNLSVGAALAAIYQEMGYTAVSHVVVELTDDTVRAPDVSVVDRDIGRRQTLVPEDVLLAVEISNSTLHEDIGRKRIDYASAGIRHYWVVDLAGRRVHCYADPQGADYAAIGVFSFGDSVPVPATSASITIG
jgi:Uma2 family endonuclease